MKEWTVLYDKTFTEDTDKVVIEDAKYEEVEAYVFIKTKINTNDNLFFTANSDGTVYGNIRTSTQINGSWIGIIKLSLRKITNFLWESGIQVSNYFLTSSPAYYPLIGYSNNALNTELDSDRTNGITLIYQNGTKFQTGDRVFIRAR